MGIFADQTRCFAHLLKIQLILDIKLYKVIRLINHEYTHRLRVGDWRILFNVFEEISIAGIEEVKKRDERTY